MKIITPKQIYIRIILVSAIYVGCGGKLNKKGIDEFGTHTDKIIQGIKGVMSDNSNKKKDAKYKSYEVIVETIEATKELVKAGKVDTSKKNSIKKKNNSKRKKNSIRKKVIKNIRGKKIGKDIIEANTKEKKNIIDDLNDLKKKRWKIEDKNIKLIEEGYDGLEKWYGSHKGKILLK